MQCYLHLIPINKSELRDAFEFVCLKLKSSLTPKLLGDLEASQFFKIAIQINIKLP